MGFRGFSIIEITNKPWFSNFPYYVAILSLFFSLIFFIVFSGIDSGTYVALRGNLFAGFFTVAGFLMAAKSNVILNMKKEVYEKQEYLISMHKQQWAGVTFQDIKLMEKRPVIMPGEGVYSPLVRTGNLLSFNITASLLTSVLQLTCGLYDNYILRSICISFAFSTLCVLVCSVVIIWANFQSLYSGWESEAQNKLDQMWKEAVDEFKKGETC